ncbi:hypothetical protein GCM10022386_00570 [Flavobacterium cheonhonense]|jgi:hypothetical protein|uniref:Anti-sigma factor n=1 Tax=Flavobacterium cheonhonense TaxID=706185 RepID=A0ABP7T5U8_9FLAO|nr:hypothetical protein [Flavobacterium cheonhonense]
MKPFTLNDNEAKITTGFKHPEGYFEALESKLSAQLPTNDPKVIAFYQRKTTWLYAAAAVVILFVSIPIYQNVYHSSTEVDALVLEDYIATHADISAEDLATVLEKEDLEKIKLELNLGEEAIEDVLLNNNDLEQYMLD